MRTFTHNGVEYIVPSRQDILNLKVGDLAPDCWGKMCKVTAITAQRDDIHGKAFVCYYVEFGVGSTISNALKEDKLCRTFKSPVLKSVELDDIETLARKHFGVV